VPNRKIDTPAGIYIYQQNVQQLNDKNYG